VENLDEDMFFPLYNNTSENSQKKSVVL